jgi:hypothetical protein
MIPGLGGPAVGTTADAARRDFIKAMLALWDLAVIRH